MGDGQAGKAVVAVLFLLGSLVLAGTAVMYLVIVPGLEGVPVGPSAEDIAHDPMLHLDIEGATASKVYEDQAREGGLANNGGSKTSEAFRVWEPDGAQGLDLLTAAVEAGPAHGVVWRGIECFADSTRFGGYKDVEADGTLIDANVSVLLSTYDGQTKLHIELSSDGGATYVNRGSHRDGAPYVAGDPCPPEVEELFRRHRPDA